MFVTVLNLVPSECENAQLITKLEESIRRVIAKAIPAVAKNEEEITFIFPGNSSPRVKRDRVLIRVEGLSEGLEIQGNLGKEIEDAFRAVFGEAFSLPRQRKVKALIYKPETCFS